MGARALLAAAAVGGIAAACGSSSGTSPAPTTLSDAERAAAAWEVAFNVAVSERGLRVRRAGATSAAVRAAVTTCSAGCSSHSCFVNCPVTGTASCSLGGSATTSGSLRGTADIDLTGVLAIDQRQTYSGCKTAAGVTIDGDPNTTVTGTLRFVAGAPAGQQVVRVGGAVRLTSERGFSTSCPVDLTVTFTPIGGSASGTVCGVPVSVAF